MSRRDELIGFALDEDEADWLDENGLPDGASVEVVDEVQLWGQTYDRLSGSALYLPATVDPVRRLLQRKAAERPMPIGVDLFCGAGGFSLGMHQGGIDVVAAVEWDVAAARTYLYNLALPDCDVVFASDEDRKRWDAESKRAAKRAAQHGDEDDNWSIGGNLFGSAYADDGRPLHPGGCRAFFFGDVRKIRGHQIIEAAGAGDEIDVVFGGPPCQGLSTANSKACLEDPRNALIWEFMRVVAELRPKSFLIENVPAILTVAKGALFNAIAKLANDVGYDVVANKLNAADFGVPQHRVRAIIAGTREDVPDFVFPWPTNWALGRPREGKRWTQDLLYESHDKALDRRLPPEAKYDPATRTWSVPEEGDRQQRAAAKRARRAKKAKQLELDEQEPAA